MEYSEVISGASQCKFAPDSSYFINYDTGNKLNVNFSLFLDPRLLNLIKKQRINYHSK